MGEYLSVVDTVRQTLKRAEYMKVNLEFRDALVAKMEENHKILREAGEACDLRPNYDGANKIYSLRTREKQAVKTKTYPSYLASRTMTKYDIDTIKRLAEEYVAECTLLGITIKNPYAMEIIP